MAERKANGDGTLRQRKDGTWEYRVVIGYDNMQKPVRKSFYGKGKSEPKQKYKEYLKCCNEKKIEHVKTVGEWALNWLDIYKKGRVEDGTYRNYALYIRNHIAPAMGHLRFEQVRPAHIEKFMKEKSGLSSSAQHHIKIALSAIFETAIDNNFCIINPCRKIKLQKNVKQEPKIFTKDTLSVLLEHAPAVKYGHIIELLLYTDLRIGELAGLQWRDIDEQERIITVRRSIARKEGGGFYVKSTKSGKQRYIGVTDKLSALLSRIPRNGLYVLAKTEFEYWDTSELSNRYKTAFEAINAIMPDGDKIEYLSPHKCRHTYATYLVKGGANIREVQQLLGHSSVNVTEIYTHIDTDDIKSSVLKLPY